MKAALVFNPSSGGWRGSRKRVDFIRSWLGARHFELECLPTTGPGDATRLAAAAAARGNHLVIAYGGDGTVNEVIAGLWGTATRLGILPGGTANVLAGELGIPPRLRDALGVLTQGWPRMISLGRANDRPFILMAGIGLDAAVVAGMPESMKFWLGKTAFWIQGFRLFKDYRLQSFEVECEGRSREATFAVIANGKNYGGGLVIAPQADLGSDRLDVCLFHSRRKSRFFLYLGAVLLGRHLRLPDVSYWQVQQVRAHGHPHIPVQVDGELAGHLPMTFQVSASALCVLVPRRAEGEEIP